jgi:hypothetical protein
MDFLSDVNHDNAYVHLVSCLAFLFPCGQSVALLHNMTMHVCTFEAVESFSHLRINKGLENLVSAQPGCSIL